MSKLKPASSYVRQRPPSPPAFFSSTTTFQPLCARLHAALSPAKPPPITTARRGVSSAGAMAEGAERGGGWGST